MDSNLELDLNPDLLLSLAIKKPREFYSHPDLLFYLSFSPIPDKHPLSFVRNLWSNPNDFLSLKHSSKSLIPLAALYSPSDPWIDDILLFVSSLDPSFANHILNPYYLSPSVSQSIISSLFLPTSLSHLSIPDSKAQSLIILRAKNIIDCSTFLQLVDYIPNDSLFSSYKFLTSFIINYDRDNSETLALISKLRPHYKKLFQKP